MAPARGTRIGVPLVLLAVVLACDAAMARIPWASRPGGVLLTGALDEPAHLATAALALLACCSAARLAAHRRAALVVLAAAVLIDLDHVPLYAGVPHVALGGRPFTHSLLTPVVLGAASLVTPRRARRWLRLVAVGVLLHLVRDVATGPGVLLLWPASDAEVLVPYGAYLAVVALLALVAAVRAAAGGALTPAVLRRGLGRS